ncbi:MAG: type V CRISPR-associated protein Cas4 [Planctomycetia bacterium]|nr:type V CRISPR-associated protein Cas4 [Planctomycetia bacterium]
MEQPITVSTLNDFIFCPASIYYHQMYENLSQTLYQTTCQLEGSAAHAAIDDGRYSTRKNVLQGVSVYCEKYNLIGKIDIFHINTGVLVERKKKIIKIYDGYVFQIYAQCFALREMDYSVRRLRLYSMDDNRNHEIPLPEEDAEMLAKFESTLQNIRRFDLSGFQPTNSEKCKKCIYRPFCDRPLYDPEDRENET